MPLLTRNYHVLTALGLFLNPLNVLARHLVTYNGIAMRQPLDDVGAGADLVVSFCVLDID